MTKSALFPFPLHQRNVTLFGFITRNKPEWERHAAICWDKACRWQTWTIKRIQKTIHCAVR